MIILLQERVSIEKPKGRWDRERGTEGEKKQKRD